MISAKADILMFEEMDRVFAFGALDSFARSPRWPPQVVRPQALADACSSLDEFDPCDSCRHGRVVRSRLPVRTPLDRTGRRQPRATRFRLRRGALWRCRR